MSKPQFLSVHEEMQELLSHLGRGNRDSEVRDTHLTQILNFFMINKNEDLKTSMAKLTLITGMGKRNLRENYIEGLIAFGIIRITVKGNSEIWEYIGLGAFQKKHNNGDNTQ